MTRITAALFLAVTAATAQEDGHVDSRRNALELAGAWTNDGFKLRDGHWSGTIEPGGSRLIRVNLFAGNHYWFTFAGTAAAKKVGVSVFDESGKSVEFEAFTDGSRAAAGFAPAISGPYIIKMQSLDAPRGEFSLVYSYR